MKTALTYDDIQLVPAFSNIKSRQNIKLHTLLSERYGLLNPIVASPMDTVCEFEMAYKMAMMGGVGCIHRFMSIGEQADIVKRLNTAIYHETIVEPSIAEAWGVMYDDWHAEMRAVPIMAAIGVQDEDKDRAMALVDAGANVLLIDVAHGDHQNVLDMIHWCVTQDDFQHVDIIAGNIATAEAAKFLCKLGVDIVKVGIGPGSICTTRLVAGIGVPQLSALLDAKKGLSKNVKMISDGGVKFSGDIAKALAAGADAVMVGSMIAGTNEAPGKIIKKNGKLFKVFRGMGSVGAMNKGSADRYFQKKQKDSSKYVPEGVEGLIKYKGDVSKIIFKLIGGLKSSMGYLGSKNVINLRNKPKFVKITKAGFYESMVHSIDEVKKNSQYL